MTEDEQKLLRTASEAIMQLVRDRDDMVAVSPPSSSIFIKWNFRKAVNRRQRFFFGETRLPMTAAPPVNPPPQY
jgi:hypothetical protein